MRTSDEEARPADDRESLVGTVERTVFHAKDTRWTVLRLHVPGAQELVTAVGRCGELDEGAEATFLGRWIVHPTHGRQFQFERIDVALPSTPIGVQRRLVRYPGIRDVLAQRIVARFGAAALRVLEDTPERLLEVEGIGRKTLERILEHHRKQDGPVARIEARLLELDLPPHLAGALHARYAEGALEVLRSEPYRLAREVRGIGFGTADRVARAMGLDPGCRERVEAGTLHVLREAEHEGHCALPLDTLVARAAQLLEVDAQRVLQAAAELRATGELVVEERGGEAPPLCFHAELHGAEERVAGALSSLVSHPVEAWTRGDPPRELAERQVAVLEAVATRRVVVLTGGPGTGKSTVVRSVLSMARERGVPAHLCAPTGRAAKRLEQATGQAASTVHRLLEIQPDSGRFLHGAAEPLAPGLLVVDETSMLDLPLADALLAALTTEHRLLLVGDADQLPSVGPGNVLRDVMTAAAPAGSGIEVVCLREVFRQAEGSSIVRNAHRILRGARLEPDAPGSGGEFFVVTARSSEHVRELVLRTVLERIPEAYGLDPRNDVQVLAPMHRGACGTVALNESLQAHHGAGREVLELGGPRGRRFRLGDRVLQTRNDYGRGVFNGDLGTVVALDGEERVVTADFDGQRAQYGSGDVGPLQLGWACSIHKSQGSEFPAVVVALANDHHVMLRRNLLYTAVTRARRLCVVVAEPRALDRAIRRADDAGRHTGLARRLARWLESGPHWEPDGAG